MSTVRPRRTQRSRTPEPVRPLRPAKTPAAPPVETKGVDWLFAGLLAALISFGTLMIYSATALDGTGVLVRMGIWIGLGCVGLLGGVYLPPKFWRAITPIAVFGSLGALIALKYLPEDYAPEINGAVRWIILPGGFSIQPSEFAKLAFVLFGAQYLETRGPKMGLFSGKHWFRFLLILGAMAWFIYKEPDLGTALVMGATAFCMLILSGVDWKPLVLGVIIVGVSVGYLAWNTEHQKARLMAYVDPWHEQYRMSNGYQVIQSWMAMARGGTTGVGLGQSQQKHEGYLPEAETDFIFAVVAEELGLYRALLVIAAFGALIWRGYGLVGEAPDRYQGLLVAGVVSWIAVQTCMNLGVVTGTLPNTGVPLPFISSGGSSTMALMTATGIVIGVSRRRPVKLHTDKDGVI